MPYQFTSVIFSDRAKIFFVLISFPQPQKKKMPVCNVCIFACLTCAGFEDFLAAQLFLYPFMAYLKDSAWVFLGKF